MYLNILGLSAFSVLATLGIIGYTGASYDDLGCYRDTADRDLSKSEITFPEGALTVAECVSECVLTGWPYVGLQEGKKCFCGTSYGKHGRAVNLGNIDCNYTCNGDTEWCGGKTANSVYYTIKTDAASKSARSLVAYETPKNYESARQDCIQNNGDLAIANTVAAVDEIVALLASAELNDSSQRKMWFGLLRHPNTSFGWTDPNEAYSDAAMTSFWSASDTGSYSCVVLGIETGLFETTSCLAQFPYVCNQAGPVDTSIDYPDSNVATVDTSEEGGVSTLALAIVMPIFFICYGGSCILYCVHKLYRNCKRRRKMLLDKENDNDEDFSEFEPNNKPEQKKGMDNNAFDQAFSPPPYLKTSSRRVSEPEGPAVESEPVATTSSSVANNRQHWTQFVSRDSMESMGPVVSSRPTTRQSVHLSLAESYEHSPPGTADPDKPPVSPPPGYYQQGKFEKQAMKVRAEKRRNKLLENALSEARERRAREKSSLSSRSGGTASQTSLNMIDENTTVAVSRPNTSKNQPDYSRPSTSKSVIAVKSANQSKEWVSATDALLSRQDNESRRSDSSDEYDPTKMSIADIIKMKMMIKDNKKRRSRKILTS